MFILALLAISSVLFNQEIREVFFLKTSTIA